MPAPGTDPVTLDWAVLPFALAALLVGLTLRAAAGVAAARAAGDARSELAGRLTLLRFWRHADPSGWLAPLILAAARFPLLFGWPRPLGTNPDDFPRRRRGLLLLGLAGPAANLAAALAAFALLALLLRLGGAPAADQFLLPPGRLPAAPGAAWWLVGGAALLRELVLVNLVLAGLYLLPLPGLDGFFLLEAAWPRLEILRYACGRVFYLAFFLGALAGRDVFIMTVQLPPLLLFHSLLQLLS